MNSIFKFIKINKIYYLQYMKSSIFFSIFIALVSSAIIGTQVFTLTRTFGYKINITIGSQNLIEYIRLANASLTCKPNLCYYGWIDNSTSQNGTIQGYNPFIELANPFFYVQFSSNNTQEYSVNRNSNLANNFTAIIDIVTSLIAPSYLIMSNISPFTSPTTMTDQLKFQPLSLFKSNKSISNVIDYAQLDKMANSSNTTNVYVAERTFTTGLDLIEYYLNNNALLYRKIVYSGNESSEITINLTNDKLFQDLGIFQQLANRLSQNNTNRLTVQINNSTLLPNYEQLRKTLKLLNDI